MKRPALEAPLAGFLAFALIAFVSHLRPSAADNYIVLANALLRGHAWVDDGNHAVAQLPAILTYLGSSIDALLYHGKYYVIEGPLPALLLMPFVALGFAVNQTTFAALLAGVAVGAGWEIARRLGTSFPTRVFLCGFLLLGTDLFWCAMLGDVWFLAHTSTVAFTLLALLELHGKRRAWIVALCAACAAESRFSMVAAIPVYAALLATDPEIRTCKRRLLAFCATLLPFALFWVAYNETRWNVPYDIGYLLFYHSDLGAGKPTGTPFQLQFLGYQLYSFFVRLPQQVQGFPYLFPTPDGVALTWTSPALFLAFLARGPRRWILALWAAALLTAIPNLLYYVDGHSQFGMRHALDFEPFLFVLMILAVRERFAILNAVLCSFSMLAGSWGVWYWLKYYRPL
jgi:hypothetical protein